MKKVSHALCFLAIFSLSACFDTDVETADLKQLTKEVEAIDAFLKTNSTDYIGYHSSGIRIVVQEFGELPPPHSGQRIAADVKASLFSTNAVLYDSIVDNKLDNILGEGLQFGITTLLAGTKAKLYIPSKYAYGAAGTTGVPPNSTIVYTVNLKTVTRTSVEQSQFQTDTAAIKSYIKTNEIENAIAHPSGIWYTVDIAGKGAKPKPYDAVSFEYEGYILSTGVSFDENTIPSIGIFGLVDGLKVALPLMRVGETRTVYIPSGLGYGPNGTEKIAENEILKFKIKLIDIVN